MNWLDLFRTHAADAEEYAAGEWIYREGEEGTLLFVLLAGDVELSADGAVADRLRAPDFFGEASALGCVCRPDGARAATAARVLPIGPARLAALAEKHPTLRAVLAEAATRRSDLRSDAGAHRALANRS